MEKAFLRPAVSRPNLDIMLHSQVTRVLFNASNVAHKVEFTQKNQTYYVNANKEIIISAGTVGSAHILLSSGVGPKEHLREMNVPLIADLPVGQNLQDQVAVGGNFYVLNDSVAILESRDVNAAAIGLFIEGRGVLTSPEKVEATGWINTKYQNASENWPDMQIFFISGRFALRNTVNDEIKKSIINITKGDSITVRTVVLRPKSRGIIKLRSNNPLEYPFIDPKYFADENDLLRLIDGMKFISKYMKTAPMQKYNPQRVPGVLPGCEGMDTTSDAYYECWARTWTFPTYHQVGTCKMGNPTDETTVVDPQLRVKKVTGLRVADASIMPTITSGNTMAPCIMIGEKLADMIRQNNA